LLKSHLILPIRIPGFFDRLAALAAQLKLKRGEDAWARAALLGAAFRTGEVKDVASLALEVVRGGAAAWQLESTLQDIDDAAVALPDSENKQRLKKYPDQLAADAEVN